MWSVFRRWANGAGSHSEVVDIILDDIYQLVQCAGVARTGSGNYQLGYRGHDHSSEKPAPAMDTAT